MNDNKLNTVRARIDEIDAGIQRLIDERIRQAKQIAALKSKDGDPVFHRPEREAEVIRMALERNRKAGRDGAAPGDEGIACIFREIISASLAAQKPVTIATLGPEGTYTHDAAIKHFGGSARVLLMPSIRDIFREVEASNADFGIAPVENSSEGSVADTLEVLIETPLKIVGELELRIQHCLLGVERQLSGVKEVLAHGQALGQCRGWLGKHLPQVPFRVVSSNAEAARMAHESPTVAAIAGERAAALYDLNVLARGVEDSPCNTTRFVVLGNLETRPSGADKTSLLIAGRNKPGALYSLLKPVSEAGLDMSWIESRATRIGLWEYVFFMDFYGHRLEPKVARVLEELEEQSALCKVLGSYPRHVA